MHATVITAAMTTANSQNAGRLDGTRVESTDSAGRKWLLACGRYFAIAVATLAAGCAAPRAPSVAPSQGHITAPAPKAEIAATDIPPPARLSTFVPPPRPSVKPQTYSVVVNEVPVKELLLALSRDTKQNIACLSG